MKANFKPNEIYLIFKCGIFGALALNGVCIILFLVGFAVRGTFISHLYSQTFAKCSLEGLFIATSGFGFILGLIIRRRFRIIQKGIGLMAVAAIPLILGAWLLSVYAAHVEISREIKLADCTNGIAKIYLKIPKGHNYYLVLALPADSIYMFSGRVHILRGTSMIADFAIKSDQAARKTSRFSLTGGFQNTNAPWLSQFVEAQKEYNIDIDLNPPPPPASIVCLHWWQAYKDKDN